MTPLVPDSGKRVYDLFRQQYGLPPVHVVSAPGRVNLIGEHVDYNSGIVLPFAIHLKTSVAVSFNQSRRVKACSEQLSESYDFPVEESQKQVGWGRYLQGILDKRRERGVECSGVQVAIASDLPTGAGLSSSAAFCVALYLAMEGEHASLVEPFEAGRLCQAVEHEYAGVPCGLMDQLAVLAANPDHLLQIDFADHSLRHIPWIGPGIRCVLINSGVKHQLAESEYGRRREECERAARILGVATLRTASMELLEQGKHRLTDREYRRVRHVVSEIERTGAAIEACLHGDADRLGELLSASHASLRNDYEVSCAELDLLVELAKDLPGFLGARLTGGGFGGSIIALLRHSESASHVDARFGSKVALAEMTELGKPLRIMAEQYQAATGNCNTVQACYPSAGALALLKKSA